MEMFLDNITMLTLFGGAVWAAMCCVLFLAVRPAGLRIADDWAKPAAFAVGAVAFGLVALLAIPGSVLV